MGELFFLTFIAVVVLELRRVRSSARVRYRQLLAMGKGDGLRRGRTAPGFLLGAGLFLFLFLFFLPADARADGTALDGTVEDVVPLPSEETGTIAEITTATGDGPGSTVSDRVAEVREVVEEASPSPVAPQPPMGDLPDDVVSPDEPEGEASPPPGPARVAPTEIDAQVDRTAAAVGAGWRSDMVRRDRATSNRARSDQEPSSSGTTAGSAAGEGTSAARVSIATGQPSTPRTPFTTAADGSVVPPTPIYQLPAGSIALVAAALALLWLVGIADVRMMLRDRAAPPVPPG